MRVLGDHVMTLGQWTIGWALLALQVAAAVVAGNGLRRRLVPGWRGLAAGVAAGVAALTVVVGVSLVLGTAGLLRQWALPPALVVAAWLLDPRRAPWQASPQPPGEPSRPDDGAPAPGGREARWARGVAWVAAGVVAASWIERVVAVYRRGMTDGDSLMYHLPFAARFLQSGWTTGTDPIGPDAWVAFYPANVEVLEAALMLPFGADVLVPVMNLGWLALALAAAASIGATAGRAALGLLMGALVVAAPVMVATQGGTARVDVATVALVLAAAALVLQRPRTVGSCALGGLALGLAIGTKFVVLPLAGLVLAAVALALWRRHGVTSAVAWCGGAVVTSAYWYVRNWVATGNPIPAMDLKLGPLGFAPLPRHRLDELDESTLADIVAAPGFWGNIGRPLYQGLTGSMVLSSAVVVAALAAVVGMARRRPVDVRHAVALAALVGCLAYPFTPNTAPLAGNSTQGPISAVIVVLNVRYLLPSLALLLCMLPVALGGGSRRLAHAGVVAGAIAVAGLWYQTTVFDGEWPVTGGDTAIGLAIAATAGVVALGVAAMSGSRDPGRAGSGGEADRVEPGARRWLTPVGAVAVLGVAGVVWLSGWVAAGRSGLRSYADMPPDIVVLWQATEDLPGEEVALLRGWVQYPHMGDDLDKQIDYVGLDRSRGLSEPPSDCDELWQAVGQRDYDIVVVQLPTFAPPEMSARDVECLEGRGYPEPVVRNGVGAVFAL